MGKRSRTRRSGEDLAFDTDLSSGSGEDTEVEEEMSTEAEEEEAFAGAHQPDSEYVEGDRQTKDSDKPSAPQKTRSTKATVSRKKSTLQKRKTFLKKLKTGDFASRWSSTARSPAMSSTSLPSTPAFESAADRSLRELAAQSMGSESQDEVGDFVSMWKDRERKYDTAVGDPGKQLLTELMRSLAPERVVEEMRRFNALAIDEIEAGMEMFQELGIVQTITEQRKTVCQILRDLLIILVSRCPSKASGDFHSLLSDMLRPHLSTSVQSLLNQIPDTTSHVSPHGLSAILDSVAKAYNVPDVRDLAVVLVGATQEIPEKLIKDMGKNSTILNKLPIHLQRQVLESSSEGFRMFVRERLSFFEKKLLHLAEGDVRDRLYALHIKPWLHQNFQSISSVSDILDMSCKSTKLAKTVLRLLRTENVVDGKIFGEETKNLFLRRPDILAAIVPELRSFFTRSFIDRGTDVLDQSSCVDRIQKLLAAHSATAAVRLTVLKDPAVLREENIAPCRGLNSVESMCSPYCFFEFGNKDLLKEVASRCSAVLRKAEILSEGQEKEGSKEQGKEDDQVANTAATGPQGIETPRDNSWGRHRVSFSSKHISKLLDLSSTVAHPAVRQAIARTIAQIMLSELDGEALPFSSPEKAELLMALYTSCGYLEHIELLQKGEVHEDQSSKRSAKGDKKKKEGKEAKSKVYEGFLQTRVDERLVNVFIPCLLNELSTILLGANKVSSGEVSSEVTKESEAVLLSFWQNSVEARLLTYAAAGVFSTMGLSKDAFALAERCLRQDPKPDAAAESIMEVFAPQLASVDSSLVEALKTEWRNTLQRVTLVFAKFVDFVADLETASALESRLYEVAKIVDSIAQDHAKAASELRNIVAASLGRLLTVCRDKLPHKDFDFLEDREHMLRGRQPLWTKSVRR